MGIVSLHNHILHYHAVRDLHSSGSEISGYPCNKTPASLTEMQKDYNQSRLAKSQRRGQQHQSWDAKERWSITKGNLRGCAYRAVALAVFFSIVSFRQPLGL